MVRDTVVGDIFMRRPASAKLACSATQIKVRSVFSLSMRPAFKDYAQE
jgi:hypothetical protein